MNASVADCRRLTRARQLAGPAVAAVLGLAYLAGPPMGADLTAQIARADFARDHGLGLLDLRWYGGIDPVGYSVLSPPLMAALGPRLVTALAYVAGAVLLAVLLRRLNVLRPTWGAVAGALCLTGNLVSSRGTFALGLAVSLGALLAAAARRRWAAVVLAVLTPLASPVAGLFLVVAAAAILLHGRVRDGMAVGLAAGIPLLLVGLAFGDTGRMTFTAGVQEALVGCLVVALVCRTLPVLRTGALLAALLVAVTYMLPSPVGSNSARLPELFAVPVVVAAAPLALPWVITLAAALVVWAPPVYVAEIRGIGDPALRPAFYQPLVEELRQREIPGPVEVVPLRRHGEAAYVARVVPLARGWLRQVDVVRNPLFYEGTLDGGAYRRWLDDNAVGWVAIASAPRDRAAREEAALVRAGLPYLDTLWADDVWTLYEVADPAPVVTPPGRVITRTPAHIQLSLPSPGTYDLRVRWSRWLTVSSGRLAAGPDGWTRLTVAGPGTVTVSAQGMARLEEAISTYVHGSPPTRDAPCRDC